MDVDGWRRLEAIDSTSRQICVRLWDIVDGEYSIM